MRWWDRRVTDLCVAMRVAVSEARLPVVPYNLRKNSSPACIGEATTLVVPNQRWVVVTKYVSGWDMAHAGVTAYLCSLQTPVQHECRGCGKGARTANLKR